MSDDASHDSDLAVGTDPSPVPVLPVDDKDARIAELEAKVAEQAAYIEELEADPYRPADESGDLGVVTDQLVAYEQEQKLAEQQAWDRDYGNLTPEFPDDDVPSDDDLQDAGA